MPDHHPSNTRDAWSLAGLHAVLAVYFWMGRGVTIVHDFGPDPWTWFWQNVPSHLLRDQPVESLWWLHAQPPLWNALGALLLKIFGDNQLPALQGLNILLGAGVVALVVSLVRRLTGSRRWSMAAGAAMAVHPALFLYEAYALYTVLVAFLVLLGARVLDARRDNDGWWPLLGFVAVVSTLVLTRSLFHLVLVVGAVPFVLLLRGRPPMRAAVLLTLLVMAPAGWYAKNQVQHGFFGGSSWYGMSLWRTVLFQQDPELLRRSLAEGSLDPVVQVAPFSPPSAYVSQGYDAPTRIPLLARDDLHNVNVPDISAGYARSAWTLVRAAPARYATNVLLGYANFSAPSALFSHLGPNRERMGWAGKLDQWVLLRPVAHWLETGPGIFVGSLYFFLIPLIVLAWGVTLARAPAAGGWRERIQRDATLAAVVGLLLYTVVVGCSMEMGENVRFKFLLEPALLVLAVVTLHRLVQLRRRTPGAEEPAHRPAST